MKINAKISYKVKPTHPDIQDMPEKYWKDKVFTYEDISTFDEDWGWDYESAVARIKQDLKLIAGGGYNSDHIYDVEFTIKKAR